MLSLILADSELELIPKELYGDPTIRKQAERRGKSQSQLLLDSSVHHSAMRGLPDSNRRGRPDIVHIFLLVCLDSILNIEGKLETLVHTRNNQLIKLSRETRLPKNYGRFVGLVEELFRTGAVPDSKSPLLTFQRNRTLSSVIKETGPDKVFTLSPNGKMVSLPRFFDRIRGLDKRRITCVIGGFPEGDFLSLSDIQTLSDGIISIHKEALKVWTVASEVLVNYRNALKE